MDAHGSLDWWSHSVSGFEKIPGPSQSSLVKHYTEEEKVSFTFGVFYMCFLMGNGATHWHLELSWLMDSRVL